MKINVGNSHIIVEGLPSGGNEPGYRLTLIDELPVVRKGELPRSARKKRVPPLSLT